VTVVAVGEFIATGWISRCTKDGVPPASCTQQVRVVARGADCAAEAVATATPSADEVWDVSGLSAGLEYTAYGISSNSTGSSCSDPLDFTAEGEPPSVERLQFYPSMEYTFVPDLSVGVTQVRFILRADPPITTTSEIIVPINENDEFRATVTCSFAGDGVLEVLDDSAGSSGEVLDRVPISCDVVGEPGGSSSSGELFGGVGLLASEPQSTPPSTVRGQFVSYVETSHDVNNVTTTVSRPDEDDDVYTRDESHATTVTFDGSQRCREFISTIDSKTQTRRHCEDQRPPSVLWTGAGIGTGSGTRTEEYFNPPGKLKSRSVRMGSSSFDYSMQFTVAFPDIPPGMIISAVRIRQNNVFDFTSSNATMGFALVGPAGASASPSWTETNRVGPCPSILGKDWTWVFPEPQPTPNHTYEFQLTASTNCTENYGETVIDDQLWRRVLSGPSTTTYGTMSVQVYAEAELTACHFSRP
jgi:hypothetical protein